VALGAAARAAAPAIVAGLAEGAAAVGAVGGFLLLASPVVLTLYVAQTNVDIILSGLPAETDSTKITVAKSHDPNGSTGPGGFGPAGFIAPNHVFPYRIDFENSATAPNPAQEVRVTDQLDPSLDWNSFELTEVGFGDTFLPIAPGQQHFQTSIDVMQNGKTFEVQIELGLDPATGKV